ncbi:hypothetical protein [Bacteroides nordii]|uniref:hypothetical protein n=1 Tax=Bacteroides nordii TaxID=291645 RepID=UPI0021E6C923|nr:hypothetical protein [Bacteroides nordii]
MKFVELLLKYRFAICVVSMYFLCWNRSGDAYYAFQLTLYGIGMYIFNFNVAYAYRAFKSNGFNYHLAKAELNWRYFCISTPLVVVAFIIFLYDSPFWIYTWLVSAGMMAILFVYDLIVNGLR